MGEVLQVPGPADVLAELPRGLWVAVGGLTWPTPSLTTADVVVIGPGGVFVVVHVDPGERPATVLLGAPWVAGQLRADLVDRAEAATAAVRALVPGLEPRHLRPVLCFAQQPMLLERCEDVIVCSTSNLVSVLTSREPVLAARQVHTVHARLRVGMRRAGAALDGVPAQAGAVGDARAGHRGVAAGFAVALVVLVMAGLGLAVAALTGSGGSGGSASGALVGSRTTAHPVRLGRPRTVAGPAAPAGLRVTVRSVQRSRDGQHVEVRLVVRPLGGRSWRGDPARAVRLVTRDGRRFAGRAVPGGVSVAVPPRAEPARVQFRLGRGALGVAAWRVR